jgi:DNA transformation protein
LFVILAVQILKIVTLIENDIMTKLCNALNIGKVLELKLNTVGINSLEELQQAGTENAFAKIMSIDKNAGRTILFSIDGAISEVPWHKIDKNRKERLKDYYNELRQRN